MLIGVLAITAARLLLIYAPPLQAMFDTRALSFDQGALVVATGVAALLIIEGEKALVRVIVALGRRHTAAGD